MKCRWDNEAKDYLVDGTSDPCRVDEEGEPTRHCTARRTCSVHLGWGELTCPRCIARARANLRRIPSLSALMLPVAITTGVNSEAANLAAPAADPEQWTARRIAMRSHLAAWETAGRISESQHLHARATMEDDDEQHPLNVLGRWAMMIAEDYGHDLPRPLTVVSAADYLDRQLVRIANDEEQEFPLFAAEIRKCRQHLDRVLSVSLRKERGAPCPDCKNEGKAAPRMVREYGHYCEDPDCDRINYDTDEADIWVCPHNRNHWRTVSDYDHYLAERKGA